MSFSDEDIQMDHLCHGPGQAGRLVVTHLPTGLSVAEDIPKNKSARSIQYKLLAALKQMVLERAQLPSKK